MRRVYCLKRIINVVKITTIDKLIKSYGPQIYQENNSKKKLKQQTIDNLYLLVSSFDIYLIFTCV